ncbi:MAG: hypothetical protein M0Z31_03620 [Clostridia bacterium]|nr:hypothetical protein [Clostridia bacterium]
MKYLTIFMAVGVTIGVFIYTLNFVLWLFRRKEYRGAVGVFLLGVAAVVVPMYALFFQH